MHILHNISRSNGNQTMKSGQLVEHEKQNVVQKLFPVFFLKNQNWAYLWINSLKFYAVCFYCMQSWGLSYRPLAFPSNKVLLKKRERDLELVSQPHFLHDFWRKTSLLYSIYWPNFIVWLFELREILGNICTLLTRLWRHKFWNY